MGAKQSQSKNEHRKQSDGNQLQYSESSNSILTGSSIAKGETQPGKIHSRHGSGNSSTSSSIRSNSNTTATKSTRNMGTLIVVNNPTAATSSTIDSSSASTALTTHPVLQQLNSIPNFSPILHQRTIKSSNYSWINEKSIATNNKQLIHHALEISPYLNIGRLYQTLVYENANAISIRQNKLTKCIKETDKKLLHLTKNYSERQRNFAKYAEKLNKVNECTKILIRCENVILNCKQTIRILNDLLPIDEKLEPFVWGDDNIELMSMSSMSTSMRSNTSSNNS